MTDVHVLEMPARRFWAMSAMIEPIRAEADLKQMELHVSLQSKEGFEAKQIQLSELLDTTRKVEINLEPKRDDDVQGKLRQAMGQ